MYIWMKVPLFWWLTSCSNLYSATVLRIRDVLSWIRPFSHPVSGSKHFFILDPGSYIKSGRQTSFFLASYAFRNKVLVIVKKIRDPRSGKNSSRIQIPGGTVKKIRDLEKIHPRSGSRIQGVKKYRTPDPGSGSATLLCKQLNCSVGCHVFYSF
jgi:hypothetical protein